MRFRERSELHFAFPYTFELNCRSSLNRAKANGVVTEGMGSRRSVEVTPEVTQWLDKLMGPRGGTWEVIYSGVTICFTFSRRCDAMHFKLVWG